MTLDTRVRILEDTAEIVETKTTLIRAFDAVVNTGGEISDIIALTTSDVVWQCERFGTYRGHGDVSTFIGHYASRVSLSLQFLSGHTVELGLSGDRATGRWTGWQPFTFESVPWVLAGRFEDSFVRQQDRWKISGINLHVEILAPWRDGWAPHRISPAWPTHF
jgi:hypothetical protein